MKSLTAENIEQAIRNYAQKDAFWLKLLFAASVDQTIIDLDKIDLRLEEIKKESEELLGNSI
ncbi:hypothetical protein [Paenibacillus sp. 8b26]|uniref:hypothetical protein n=1 Tax=Paenibacillus sp. 8b26 TaxID=3424133 RepID=UPI003D65413D